MKEDSFKLIAYTASGVSVEIKEPSEIPITVVGIDLTEGVRFYLSDLMRETIDNIPNTNDLIVTSNGSHCLVQFFGVRQIDLQKACEELANILTDLHLNYTLVAKMNLGVCTKLIDGSFTCLVSVACEKDTNSPYQVYQGQTPKATYPNPVDLEEMQNKIISNINKKFLNNNKET